MTAEQVLYIVKGCCMDVHRSYGPGLFEKIYKLVLAKLLRDKGMHVETEVPVKLIVDGEILGNAFYADMIVNGKVIVELKAVQDLHPACYIQLQSYMRLANIPVGLLVNFGTDKIYYNGMFTRRLSDPSNWTVMSF